MLSQFAKEKMRNPEYVHDRILHVEVQIAQLRRAVGFIWGHVIATQTVVLLLLGVVIWMAGGGSCD